MNKTVKLLLFLILTSHLLISQVLPRDGSKLNYRIIGFSFPKNKETCKYLLDIAAGTFSAEDSFKKHIIISLGSKTNKLIAEVPSFGQEYTWRYTYLNSNHTKTKSALFHFRTGTFPCSDPNDTVRFRILKKAEKYKDAYVFLDAVKALYDMKGNPVWYYPNTVEITHDVMRDLKMTPQSTITFVVDEQGAYEINYDGSILWASPNKGIISGDSLEHYHHEFTRLGNGNYMVLAQNFEYWKKPAGQDTGLTILRENNIKSPELTAAYERVPMATLIEYDKKGNIAWSWKASDHFNGSKLFYRTSKDGVQQVIPHENSFFFDEKDSAVYLSARNISCIIKIKYPQGNILAVYGGDKNSIVPENMGKGLFCGQHSCSISRKGNLCIFNNNNCSEKKDPSVIMMKEPVTENDTLKKVWEYKCQVENNNSGGFASGGNVIELPDYSLFVSMGFPDSKVFIVNKDKKILWNAIAEKWSPAEKKWESIILYRASIITNRKLLEQLIWGEEKN